MNAIKNLWKRAWWGKVLIVIGALFLCGVVGSLLPDPENSDKSESTVAEVAEDGNAADETKVEEAESAEPEPTDTPKPDLGDWKAQEEINPLDDSRLVIVSLESEDRVKGWIGSAKPTLSSSRQRGVHSVNGERGERERRLRPVVA